MEDIPVKCCSLTVRNGKGMEKAWKTWSNPLEKPSDPGDAPKEGFRAAGGGQRSPGRTGNSAGWIEKQR